MARYAIVGLECSVTKALSRIVARNVSPSLTHRGEGRKPKGFDGHKNIGDAHNFVQHYSLPYGKRDNYPEPLSEDWDYILLCTRDFWCSMNSKLGTHAKDRKAARSQHDKGTDVLRRLAKYDNSYVFSYEAWYILGEVYMRDFLKQVGVDYHIQVEEALDVNRKHVKGHPNKTGRSHHPRTSQ